MVPTDTLRLLYPWLDPPIHLLRTVLDLERQDVYSDPRRIYLEVPDVYSGGVGARAYDAQSGRLREWPASE